MAVWLDLLPRIHVPNQREPFSPDAHKLNDGEDDFEPGVLSSRFASEVLLRHCRSLPHFPPSPSSPSPPPFPPLPLPSRVSSRGLPFCPDGDQTFDFHEFKCPPRSDRNSSKSEGRGSLQSSPLATHVEIKSLPQDINGALQLSREKAEDSMEKYDSNFSQDSPDVITLSSKETLLTSPTDEEDEGAEEEEEEVGAEDGEGEEGTISKEGRGGRGPKSERSWSVLALTVIVGIVFLALNLLVFGATFVQWYFISQRFKRGLYKSHAPTERNDGAATRENHPSAKALDSNRRRFSASSQTSLNVVCDSGSSPTGGGGFDLLPASTSGGDSLHSILQKTSSPRETLEKASANTACPQSVPSYAEGFLGLPAPTLIPIPTATSSFSYPSSYSCATNNDSARERLRPTVRFSFNLSEPLQQHQQQQQQHLHLHQQCLQHSQPQTHHHQRNQHHQHPPQQQHQHPLRHPNDPPECRFSSSSGKDLQAADVDQQQQRATDSARQHISAQNTLGTSGDSLVAAREQEGRGSIPGEGSCSASGLFRVLHENVSTVV